MENPLLNPQYLPIWLAGFAKRLERIEDRLTPIIPYLPAEEAVEAYRKYLKTGINKRGRYFSQDSIKNFDYFLDKFQEHFTDKNMAEIFSPDLEGFLRKYWSNVSNGCLKQRQIQLNIFFNFAIKLLRSKGNPGFQNPCEFLDSVSHIPARPEWIPIEIMRKFLESARKEHHWLAFSILLTSGIRINDLMHLRKCDIEGRILRLRSHADYRPKSGKTEEIAVIPEIVADKLASWLAGKQEKSYIIPVTEIAISKAIAFHGKQVSLKLSPHKLRKWIASYWERKNEPGMINFVLRHSAVNLKDRYVAPLSVEEVMEKQRIMGKELFFSFQQH